MTPAAEPGYVKDQMQTEPNKVPAGSTFSDAALDLPTAPPGSPAAANVPPSPSVARLASPPEQKRLTPLQAIRAKCLDCSGGSRQEVRLCPITQCPLWPYRFGKRPQAERGMRCARSTPSTLSAEHERSPLRWITSATEDTQIRNPLPL